MYAVMSGGCRDFQQKKKRERERDRGDRRGGDVSGNLLIYIIFWGDL